MGASLARFAQNIGVQQESQSYSTRLRSRGAAGTRPNRRSHAKPLRAFAAGFSFSTRIESPSSRQSNVVPGSIPNRSRSFLGTIVWPWLVTMLVMAKLLHIISRLQAATATSLST
jgi:hypothetical protein